MASPPPAAPPPAAVGTPIDNGDGTATVFNPDGSKSIVYGQSAGALAGKLYSTSRTNADGSTSTDYYFGGATPRGTNTVAPDGSSTSYDVATGTTSHSDPTGKTTGVTDSSGNNLTPAQINGINQSQGNIGGLDKTSLIAGAKTIGGIAVNPVNYGLNQFGIGSDAVTGPLSGGKVTQQNLVDRGVNQVTGTGPNLTDLAGGGGILGGGGGGTAAASAAIAQSAALAQQFNQQYQNFQPATAPTIQAAQLAPLTPAQQQAAIQYQAAQSAQIAPYQAAVGPGGIAAGSAGGGSASGGTATADKIQQTIQAQQQAAIQAQQVQAALADRTQLGPTALANQTSIDQTNAAQTRAQQEGLVGSLQGTIAGTTPSVAAILLKQQTEANIANQYALAQSANGQNVGLAQFTAMNNAGNLNQQSIGQQALLRAQEIQAAQGQLSNTLGQVGGQDINLATSQAGLQQGVNLSNQGALNTSTLTQGQLDAQRALANAQQTNVVGLANAGNNLQANTTNATLAQQVALANAAAGNNTNQVNAQLGTQTNIGNAQNQTQASIASANNATQASVANANNATSANTAAAQLAAQIAIANSNNQSQQAINQAQLTNQTNLANSQNQLTAGMTNAQLANQLAIANAANQTQYGIAQGGFTNQANIANASNQISQQQVNQQGQQNLAQNALTGQGQATTGAVGLADTQAKIEAAKYGALGTGVAQWVTSDRREKTAIGDGSIDVDRFLKDLAAYKFRYKDPTAPGTASGQRFGIMAQDLERNPVGKSLVSEGADGRKRVDIAQAAMAALAALGQLNERVSKVEKRT